MTTNVVRLRHPGDIDPPLGSCQEIQQAFMSFEDGNCAQFRSSFSVPASHGWLFY